MHAVTTAIACQLHPFFKMEAEIIYKFLPNLVTAISDNVQSVSDQCLAQGLIIEYTYKKVLESGGTSEDRARTLVLAVKNSTETDSRCLEILLGILDENLPYTVKNKLLSKIRKEVTEKPKTCGAVVPSAQVIQQLPSGELAKESALQQSSLLGRFEYSIRQHERACTEKNLLEEKLKVKSEKCKRLKEELETLRKQNQELASNTQSKITACTRKIDELKKRTKELKKIIEERDMQAKRGRNMVITQTKKLCDYVAQQESQKREGELKKYLKEIEALVQEQESRINHLEGESKPQKESHEASFAENVLPNDILKPFHLDNLYQNIEKCDNDNSCLTQWRKIGSQLGFSEEELDNIHPKNSANEQTDINHISSCTYKMLDQWLQWYPKDKRGSTSFPRYSALQRALVNARFGNVVRELSSYEDFIKEKSPVDTELDSITEEVLLDYNERD